MDLAWINTISVKISLVSKKPICIITTTSLSRYSSHNSDNEAVKDLHMLYLDCVKTFDTIPHHLDTISSSSL